MVVVGILVDDILEPGLDDADDVDYNRNVRRVVVVVAHTCARVDNMDDVGVVDRAVDVA